MVFIVHVLTLYDLIFIGDIDLLIQSVSILGVSVFIIQQLYKALHVPTGHRAEVSVKQQLFHKLDEIVSHHFCTSLTEGWLSSLSGKRLTSFMVLARRTGSSLRRNM